MNSQSRGPGLRRMLSILYCKTLRLHSNDTMVGWVLSREETPVAKTMVGKNVLPSPIVARLDGNIDYGSNSENPTTRRLLRCHLMHATRDHSQGNSYAT